MFKPQSITNVIWFAFGLQCNALKEGIELTATYLNTKSVDSGFFSPTFLVMKAIDSSVGGVESFAYVSFRVTKNSTFSSVSVLGKSYFNAEKFAYKRHVADFPDSVSGINAFSAEIVDALKKLNPTK